MSLCTDSQIKSREQLARVIELGLGESPRHAMRIARQHQQEVQRAQHNWQTAAEIDLPTAMRQAEAYHSTDVTRLGAFLNHTHAGIVLATIHMGDFLRALLAIVQHVHGRKVHILRKLAESDQERRVFAKLAALDLQVDIVRAGEPAALLRMQRSLRRGGLVVTFYDLPRSFGEVIPLNFRQHQIFWVAGPCVTAMRAKALLIPFVVYRDQRVRCDIHSPICFTGSAGRNNSVTGSVCQRLADIATAYICHYPEQWLHWPLFPQMLEDNCDRNTVV